jgi:hypothetical protein
MYEYERNTYRDGSVEVWIELNPEETSVVLVFLREDADVSFRVVFDESCARSLINDLEQAIADIKRLDAARRSP